MCCGSRAPSLPAPSRRCCGWLDLVALGTVCDVVPLTGLNRAFVHQGLKVAGAGGCPAWWHWRRQPAWPRVTDARQLGFALGPRINAGGRIGQSDLGARLLTTDRRTKRRAWLASCMPSTRSGRRSSAASWRRPIGLSSRNAKPGYRC